MPYRGYHSLHPWKLFQFQETYFCHSVGILSRDSSTRSTNPDHSDEESAIQTEIKECHICQSLRNSPPQAPIHIWQWSLQPWSRIYVDYAGTFMGHHFLVIIDVHSTWVDVYMTTLATSKVTIEKLHNTFATLGLPKVLRSHYDILYFQPDNPIYCKDFSSSKPT